MTSRIFPPKANFENLEIHLYFVCLPACCKTWLQKFHTIMVMAVDLRKCCSEDDLPAPLWQFPLSFIPLLVLLYSLSKVWISPSKVTRACYSFCLLHHTITWLAPDIISYSGKMLSHVLYYIVTFEIIALDK